MGSGVLQINLDMIYLRLFLANAFLTRYTKSCVFVLSIIMDMYGSVSWRFITNFFSKQFLYKSDSSMTEPFKGLYKQKEGGH